LSAGRRGLDLFQLVGGALNVGFCLVRLSLFAPAPPAGAVDLG